MLTRPILRRCAAAITIGVAGIGQAATAADDVIKIGYHDGPQQYNPAYISALSTAYVLGNVYDTLIREGHLSGFTGGLAERWQVSEDARIYDFWLRENAQWSDGTVIDAAYAAESFRLLGSLPDNASFLDFSEIDISVAKDEEGQDILRFVLPEPSSQFFPYLADVTNAVLPIHKADEVDFARRWESFDDSLKVYSGAYALVSADAADEAITLRPNPRYHSPDDVLNAGVDMVFFEDQDLIAISALQSGELDLVLHRASGQSTYLDETMTAYIRQIDYPLIDMLRINLERPALQDPAVRRAIAQVAMLSEETSFIEDNNLHISGSFIPTQLQTSLGYPSAPIEYAGDDAAIAAARAQMAELGFGPRNQLQIDFAVNASVLHERMANLMRARLKQIFVDARIIVQPWSDHLAMVEAREYDIARNGWGYDIAHPGNLLETFTSHSPYEYSGYNNPDYDKIIAAMDQVGDSPRLAALVTEAEAILRRDLPAIPLYQRNDTLLVHPDLVLGDHNFAGQKRFEQIHWAAQQEGSLDQS